MNPRAGGGGKTSSPYAIEAGLKKVGSSEGRRVSCLQAESFCDNYDKPPLVRKGDRVSGGRFEQSRGSEDKRGGGLQEQAKKLCHSEPYNCQAEDETIKVSGEESPRIMSGILRVKNNCHPQNDVTANQTIITSFSHGEKELVPSTYGRGIEFQHEGRVLEIQGEGAHGICQRCKPESSLFNNPLAGLLRCRAPRNYVMANQPPTTSLLIGEGEFKIASLIKRGKPLAVVGLKLWKNAHVKNLLTYLPTNLLTPVKNLVPYYPSALVPSKKAAFTLAEVLITLGIIGVIAAMTLPALIQKHRKIITATQLKKSYSTILQAFTMAQKDYGDISNWEFIQTRSVGGDLTALKDSLDIFANRYLIPYIKVIEDCGVGKDSSTQCYYNWYYPNGTVIRYQPSDNNYRFIINNSTLIQLVYDNDQGNFGGRILLYIDINGFQKPNTFGKDVFLMGITQSNSKFNMFGYEQKSRDTLMNHSGWGCKDPSSTYYCGALIQQDGWEIKDDYPW